MADASVAEVLLLLTQVSSKLTDRLKSLEIKNVPKEDNKSTESIGNNENTKKDVNFVSIREVDRKVVEDLTAPSYKLLQKLVNPIGRPVDTNINKKIKQLPVTGAPTQTQTSNTSKNNTFSTIVEPKKPNSTQQAAQPAASVGIDEKQKQSVIVDDIEQVEVEGFGKRAIKQLKSLLGDDLKSLLGDDEGNSGFVLNKKNWLLLSSVLKKRGGLGFLGGGSDGDSDGDSDGGVGDSIFKSLVAYKLYKRTFIKKILPLLKTTLKVGGAIAAVLALIEGVQGFNADKNATSSEKIENAFKAVLSGVTFGFLGESPEEIAKKAKKANEDNSKIPIRKSFLSKFKSQEVNDYTQSVESNSDFPDTTPISLPLSVLPKASVSQSVLPNTVTPGITPKAQKGREIEKNITNDLSRDITKLTTDYVNMLESQQITFNPNNNVIPDTRGLELRTPSILPESFKAPPLTTKNVDNEKRIGGIGITDVVNLPPNAPPDNSEVPPDTDLSDKIKETDIQRFNREYREKRIAEDKAINEANQLHRDANETNPIKFNIPKLLHKDALDRPKDQPLLNNISQPPPLSPPPIKSSRTTDERSLLKNFALQQARDEENSKNFKIYAQQSHDLLNKQLAFLSNNNKILVGVSDKINNTSNIVTTSNVVNNYGSRNGLRELQGALS